MVITVCIPILCAGIFLFLSSRHSALYVDGISSYSKTNHDPEAAAELFIHNRWDWRAFPKLLSELGLLVSFGTRETTIAD